MKFEVDDDDPYVPLVESNIADRLTMNPKSNQGSPLYFGEDIDKGLQIDDISSIFHYELKADTAGGLGSDHSLETKDELRYEDFNRLLHVDGVVDLHPTIGSANRDEDYILNFDFKDRVPELDYQFCEELGSENSRSESHSSGTSEEAVLIAESSLPMPVCQKDQPVKTNICNSERPPVSLNCETPYKDEMTSNSFSTYHLLDNEKAKFLLSPLDNGSAYHKNEISMSVTYVPNPSTNVKHDVGAPVSESMEQRQLSVQEDSSNKYAEVRKSGMRIRLKRLCKPAQEYAEEPPMQKRPPEQKRHSQSGMEEYSTNSSKMRNTIVRLNKKDHEEGDKIVVPIPCDKLHGRSPRRSPYAVGQESSAKYASNSRLQSIKGQNPVLSVCRLRKSRKCEVGVVDSDEEYDPSRSEVKRRCSGRLSAKRVALDKGYRSKCVDRRKHSKSWTLPEVMKLVDGISQFGVGRWTSIARTFFPSSSRTSLDIRDKWRNLVQSSFTKLKNENAQSSRSKAMPRSLMQRVSELALLHPYPRAYPRRGCKDVSGSNAEPMLPLPTRSPSW